MLSCLLVEQRLVRASSVMLNWMVRRQKKGGSSWSWLSRKRKSINSWLHFRLQAQKKINLTIFPLHQTSSSMTQAIAGPSRRSSKTSGPIAIYNHSSQHVHYTVSQQELSSMSNTSATLQPPLPLSSEEAILLQNYYLLRLPLLAKAFGLPERLLATAMSYFKRCWLFGKRNVGEPLEVGAGQRYRGGRGVKVVM